MRRKAHNKLWTYILMLLLCGASLAPGARIARADSAPSDPAPGTPGGDTSAGDPDVPQNGKSPAPGGRGGATGQTIHVAVNPHQSALGLWMLRLRMAFASVYRTLFRF